ncbi:MAG: Gfo/Idh/MocA family oxidoreductase [Oscillospiraceae bacterium]
MNQVKRIVVVGYGGMGGWHTRLIPQIPQVELAGTYDIKEDRQEAARKAGIHTYDSFEAILEDESVDLITLAIPNDLHKEFAIRALAAGKNVVSEKPVTLCSQDLEEMIAAAVKHQRLFTVHQNRRWDEDYRIAKAIYEDDKMGRIFNIESRVHGSRGIPGDWRNTKAQGGGMVLDWGVHLLDQMNMMMGRMPISVYAQLSNVTNEEVDDGFKALFTYDNGLTFHVEVGTSNFINLPRWYIEGLNGTAEITDWDINGKIVVATTDEKHDAVPIVTAAGLTKTMAPRTPDTIKELPLVRIESDIKDFYRNVAKALNGEEQALITHDQQRQLMKLMESIFESAEKNQVVYF